MNYVGICLPAGDTVKLEFALALAQLEIPANARVKYYPIRTALVNLSREMLIEAAIKDKMDYVLFIDSDMAFPPDSLTRLLKHNKDFVCANYAKKSGLGDSVQEVKKPLNVQGSLIQINVSGLGLALIKTSILEQIEAPRFEIYWDPELKTYVGEDYSFCVKLQKVTSLFSDSNLSARVGHVGSQIHTLT